MNVEREFRPRIRTPYSRLLVVLTAMFCTALVSLIILVTIYGCDLTRHPKETWSMGKMLWSGQSDDWRETFKWDRECFGSWLKLDFNCNPIYKPPNYPPLNFPYAYCDDGSIKIHRYYALVTLLALLSSVVWAYVIDWVFRRGPSVFVYAYSKHQFAGGLHLDYPIPENHSETHSHPDSANLRQEARERIRQVLQKEGLVWYSVSPSETELKYAERYSRLHHWSKDMKMVEHHDPVRWTDALVLIDVDYHVDMNAYLKLGQPMILYTMIPEVAATTEKEYSFRFNKNQLLFSCNGGGTITHELWNYERDDVVVENAGVAIRYEIVQVRLGPHRYIVMLLPSWQRPLGDLARAGISLEPLTRRIVQQNRAVRIESKLEPGKISLALAGEHCYRSFTFTGEEIKAAGIKVRNSNLTLPSKISELARVMTRENRCSPSDAVDRALVLVAYHTDEEVSPEMTDQFKADYFMSGEDGKPSGKATAPPLVEHPDVFPVRAPDLERLTIGERIDVPQKGMLTFAAIRRYTPYIMEFARLVVPDDQVGQGLPLTLEEVVSHQLKPRQKLKHRTKLMWGVEGDYRFWVKAFQKNESYKEPKAPRNISQVPYEHLVRLSCFTLSMKEHLLTLPWFGPGRTPDDMTTIVDEIAKQGLTDGHVFARDFSTFDGTVNRLLNDMVEAICMRWVNETDRKEFRTLLRKERNSQGVTEHGLRYNIGQTRVTGSPVTADHNTLINAFVSYVVRRAEGYSESEAWNKLGLYYGDDSLDYAFQETVHQEVCSELKLIAKYDLIPNGDPIPFLGRFFRDDTSICDPWRTLRKLHLSASTASDVQALANKATGYLVSDSCTPLVSTWCQRALEWANSQGVFVNPDELEGEEWWRAKMPWPQTEETARQLFLDVTSIPERELDEFSRLLDEKGVFGLTDRLPNPEPTLRRDFTINWQDTVIHDYSRYEKNSCLYQAVRLALPDHPFVSCSASPGHLRAMLVECGVLVPPVGEPADEAHIRALANFLETTITVTLPGEQTLTYNEGAPNSCTITYEPPTAGDDRGHYKKDLNKLVEQERERIWNVYGPDLTGSYLPAKFKIMGEFTLGATGILEVSPAPGYFASNWPNPSMVHLAHYVGPGACELRNPLRQEYRDRFQEFTQFRDIVEPKGVSHWVSDIGVEGLSLATNQGLVMYPIVNGLLNHWLRHGTARTIVVKWFLDADPPMEANITQVSRKGLNPKGIEVYIQYTRAASPQFNAKAKKELQQLKLAYVSGPANETLTTKDATTPTNPEARPSTPKTKGKAPPANRPPTTNPGGKKQGAPVRANGNRRQLGVPADGNRNPPLKAGAQRPARNGVGRAANEPVRQVQVQADQGPVHPDMLTLLHRSLGDVLRSGGESADPKILRGAFRQLRKCLRAGRPAPPEGGEPKAAAGAVRVVPDGNGRRDGSPGQPGVRHNSRERPEHIGEGVPRNVVARVRAGSVQPDIPDGLAQGPDPPNPGEPAGVGRQRDGRRNIQHPGQDRGRVRAGSFPGVGREPNALHGDVGDAINQPVAPDAPNPPANPAPRLTKAARKRARRKQRREASRERPNDQPNLEAGNG